LGDARVTDKGKRRHEWNVGQLLRERFGLNKTFNIGFTTYTGTVTAARSWDKPANCYKVRNGFFGSYEHLLHSVTEDWQHRDFSMIFRSNSESTEVSQDLVSALTKNHYERYIGVIYRPDTEKGSHFSLSCLPKEWDAVIHIDESKALIPIDLMHGPWEAQSTELQSVYDPDMTPEIEMSVPIPPELYEWRVNTAKKLNEIGIKLLGDGHFTLAKGKFDKALQYAEYDIVHHPELQPLRIQLLLNHAAVSYQLHAWATVTRDCSIVLEFDPQNVEAHLLLGETCKMKGQLADAQKHFDKAARYTTQHPIRTPIESERR
jgi:tetratricopeptide (TPR) repeat protein